MPKLQAAMPPTTVGLYACDGARASACGACVRRAGLARAEKSLGAGRQECPRHVGFEVGHASACRRAAARHLRFGGADPLVRAGRPRPAVSAFHKTPGSRPGGSARGAAPPTDGGRPAKQKLVRPINKIYWRIQATCVHN